MQGALRGSRTDDPIPGSQRCRSGPCTSTALLLNLLLSCLAALQGAILLIAAKREDQISSELAQHDYETNLEADRIVKEIRDLTREIHARTVGSDGGSA